jgi:phosphate-selective porin OprO/OprP
MLQRLRRRFLRLLFVGGAAALLGGAPAHGEGTDDVQALKRQFEQQKEELEEQQKLLESLKKRVTEAAQTTPTTAAPGDLPPPSDKDSVEKLVGDYLKRRDAERAAQEAAAKAKADEEGYKVGTDLGMRARWNIATGLTFDSPHKDFVSHFGFIFQYDNVWFQQSASLKAQNQLGDLQDGTFFRRVRPIWDGTAWEVMEWQVILSLEQINNNVPNIDEAWVGLKNLPVIGSVRVGRVRVPQGLEAPQTQNSKPMTFLEQSAYSQAFYEKVAPGLWTGNNYFNERATSAFMVYRQDEFTGSPGESGQNGVNFGDGKYAMTGRLTALPIYENDGRCLMHLGASATWRKAEDVPVTTGQGGIVGPTFVEFSANPLLRDFTGAYGTNGLPGNNRRIVDTGMIDAASSTVLGAEFLYIRGPFSLQAEYGWASMNDAYVSNPLPKGPRLIRQNDTWFDGGYVQLSYFLTGENRQYDRRLGRLAGSYIASPYTPFWLTRGDDGKLLVGSGAWELTFRYNYLNLDDRLIQGGKTEAYEIGVNWHLSNNFKIMCEYLHQFRFDKFNGPNGILGGDVDGLGIRTQLVF